MVFEVGAHYPIRLPYYKTLFVQVVESEPRMGADFCFNVYDGKRALMVAASSQDEKLQWMEDIVETVQVMILQRYFPLLYNPLFRHCMYCRMYVL